jgi:phosphotransferase system HPr-like phosphotransfer protein
MFFRLVLLLTVLPLAAGADEKSSKTGNTFDARKAELSQKYVEKLAALRKQYESDFQALQQAETTELKAKQAIAMLALNLDQANQLNTEIQRVQAQAATSQLRTLFVRNTSRGERAYFIRCPDGEWIERVVSRRSSMGYVYRLTAETPEYIELTHESGKSQHRLYDDRDMFRDDKKGKDDFATAGRGRWEYADAAARAAAELPIGTEVGDIPEESADEAFAKALTAVTWKGNKRGWPEDFRFAENGLVTTTSGQIMPQRWLVVRPGHIITVNDRILDSMTVNLALGTLKSNAFSEDTPAASWDTKAITTAP